MSSTSVDPVKRSIALEHAAKLTQWLRVFCTADQVVSVQGLHFRDGTRARSVCGRGEAVTQTALQFDRAGPLGVYFTPNPLKPDLTGTRVFPKDSDVSRRHWLLVDVDPVRALGHEKGSSNEGERQEAWKVLSACRGLLDSAGLTGAVVGDSGNGWHLCYPIDLPNDDTAKELVKAVLTGVAKATNTAAAQVGTECFDAKRIWPVYGTYKRKGQATADRPHRCTQLVEGDPWDEGRASRNTGLLTRLLEMWRYVDDVRKGRPTGDITARARKCLETVTPTTCGTQSCHNRTFNAAALLVKDFGLDLETSLPLLSEWSDRGTHRWTEAELRHKLMGAAAKPGPSGVLVESYRHAETQRPDADTSSDPLDQDATAADLLAANVLIRWGWERWLPSGVLSVLASEPGCGKTRFCADLARRIYLGLPWPDGALPTFPQGARTLWVPADNHHAELGSLPGAFGFAPESLYLNATRRNPFAGTMLDAPEDLRLFEARIRRVQPALVIVDTSLNATDRSSHKPEDAKAFFGPLQQIAARTGVILICVTHLNAAGTPLGRRVMGQARLVMQLEHPDPDEQPNRRRLHVVKSNSLYPPALGITMGANGNEYDANPPGAPTLGTKGTVRVQEAADWLKQRLSDGPTRVQELRTQAEAAGFSTKTIYAAKEELSLDEFTSQGRKWWKLLIDNIEGPLDGAS